MDGSSQQKSLEKRYFRGFAKGWFPKGWFGRSFLDPKSRNEGTKQATTLQRNRNRGYKKLTDGTKNRKKGTFAKTVLLQNRPLQNRPLQNLSIFCDFKSLTAVIVLSNRVLVEANLEASTALFSKAFRSLKNCLDSSIITKARFPCSRCMFEFSSFWGPGASGPQGFLLAGMGVSCGVRPTTWERSQVMGAPIHCLEEFSGEGTFWDLSLLVSLTLWHSAHPHFPSPNLPRGRGGPRGEQS